MSIAKQLAPRMAEFRSHKRVRAADIVAVDAERSTLTIRLPDGTEETIGPRPALFTRMTPKPGDYYVVYGDGYDSLSPRHAFEEGYRPIAAEHGPVAPGRIVLFVLPEDHPRKGEVRPAMIVRAWQQTDHPTYPGMCNLVVFMDGGNDQREAPIHLAQPLLWRGSVLYSAEPQPGTWHWPPRGCGAVCQVVTAG